MTDWISFTSTVTEHTVVGDLRVFPGLHSPQLHNERDILVWLPDSYKTGDKRYPVLYMHDGNNLFDEPTSYAGEWRVDETMQVLAKEGIEAIVVGVPNQGDLRVIEYNPYPSVESPELDGAGEDYTRFLVETVKPFIDESFRTLPDPAHTGTAGSSMGGLISLYGFLTRRDVFGMCGAFSPAFWFGNLALYDTVTQLGDGGGRIYMDVGTAEGAVLHHRPDAHGVETEDQAHSIYLEGVRELHNRILAAGYVEGDSYRYVEEDGALHDEPAWARRLPDALRFLLGSAT